MFVCLFCLVIFLSIFFSEFKDFTQYPLRDQNTGWKDDSALKSSQPKREQNTLIVLCLFHFYQTVPSTVGNNKPLTTAEITKSL